MAKVIRQKLARGVELLYQWIFTPLTNMAAGFNADIGVDQLKTPTAPFRVNLNIPHISARYFASNPGAMFYVPFCLPPLQDDWLTGGLPPESPEPVLTGVGFSFDQRGEGAQLADRWQYRTAANISPDKFFVSSPFEGNLEFGRAPSIEVNIALYEKSQHYYSPQVTGGGVGPAAVFAPGPQREVWSARVPAGAFTNSQYRLNPQEFAGLSEAIDPSKTYIIGINADGLYDADNGVHCTLCSFQLSLRFKRPLCARDRAVQNMPAHGGAVTGETVSITSPVQSGVIAADTAAGVSTNMEKIDARLRHKLWGGYSLWSDTPVSQQLKEDAAYDVIAVPMFGNTALGEILAEPSWWQLNGVRNAANTSVSQVYGDRIVVPITSPMTIHHVIATNNFTTATQHVGSKRVTHPNYGDWVLQVGVGTVSGPQSCNADYQQVAYGEFNPGANSGAVHHDMIDFMDLRTPTGHTTSTPGVPAPNAYEQALFAVPIVGTDGKGFFKSDGTKGVQGKPVFVGESATGAVLTQTRSDTQGVASTGHGQDQLLEIRMRINTTVGGLVYNAATFQSANWNSWDSFSGYGGCWVYIIGKKHVRS